MKDNVVTKKWMRFLDWIREQRNKPTSDSAIRRERRIEAPEKPEKTQGNRSRRRSRISERTRGWPHAWRTPGQPDGPSRLTAGVSGRRVVSGRT